MIRETASVDDMMTSLQIAPVGSVLSCCDMKGTMHMLSIDPFKTVDGGEGFDQALPMHNAAIRKHLVDPTTGLLITGSLGMY